MYYTFCNEAYVPWLGVLAHSLRRVDRSTPILVHFIGDVTRVQRLFGDLRCLTIATPPILPAPNASAPEFFEVRAENILLVAQEYEYDWLMVLDTDLLIRRSLKKLVRAMRLYDFGAVIRGSWTGKRLPPHLEVSAALYVLTKRGVPVLRHAFHLMNNARRVRGVRRGEWYWDQACLAESVLTSDLRIRTIPREIYLSSRPYDRRATVWNGNFAGERKRAALRLCEAELKRIERRASQ